MGDGGCRDQSTSIDKLTCACGWLFQPMHTRSVFASSIPLMNTGTEQRKLRVWGVRQCCDVGTGGKAKSDGHRGGNMSAQALLVILLVGLVAGWLAGQIVQGTGFGLVADIAIGIVGALIGSWLLPELGIHLGSGIVAAIISATIGALVLLLILRLFYRRGRW
jgi:uncharacterized membrane protein YeaQ/YmgE (transglycosylase-associated protein family)